MAMEQEGDTIGDWNGQDTSDGDTPARISELVGSTLGQIYQGKAQMRWTQDALLFGYNAIGVPHYYRLPYSTIPLHLRNDGLALGRSPWSKRAQQSLIERFVLIESTLQRPATQGEAEAFALSAQKFHETYRYRNFFAWTLAAGAAYRSRSNFRFPFYTPKDQTRFDSFPSKTLPMLKGSGAKLCWHFAARFPAYLIGAYWTFSPLFNAIGGVNSLLLLRQDSRSAGGIKETTEKLTQKERERHASLQTRVGQSERDSPRRYPQQVLDPITKDDPQEEPLYSDMDENQRAFQTSEQLSQAYPSNEPERRPRDQLQIASTPSSSSPGPNRNRRPESAYSSSEPAFYDDSSPSAAQGLKPTGSYQESGSAWDRVRSTSVGSDQASPWDSDQATKPQYQKKAQQRSYWGRSGRSQDENETTGDSFSFSKSTEEKELAKEQAQREFDSMVEAERGVQDGNKGGGSGGSWNR